MNAETQSLMDQVAHVAETMEGRPSWDEYFMATAMLISTRSPCERLHVGCVVVSGGDRKNRIVAAAPWKLVPTTASSRWVLRATLEHYEIRPLGLSLGSSANPGSAGSATRLEVIVTASVQLLDGVTGDVIIDRPRLTFSNQYRVDQNFASFDNQELRVLASLADDFAESFLTQLLEGGD